MGSSKQVAQRNDVCDRTLNPAHLPHSAPATMSNATLLISHHTDRSRNADVEQEQHIEGPCVSLAQHRHRDVGLRLFSAILRLQRS
ncbi:hypothetical protein V493_00200 [Pseudogymnoascus sp. VKM F-4281 (FW-2241)]|nr:hypothetical protein V493_00200 [Pseudogymnoascus sp. VKM F-4281 (FW-2241)]